MDTFVQSLTAPVLSQGILGVICVALTWMVLSQRSEIKDLNKQLVAAWKDIGAIAKENTVVIREWTITNDSRTRALEASVKSSELNVQAAGVISQNVAALISKTAEFTVESQRTREALLLKGKIG